MKNLSCPILFVPAVLFFAGCTPTAYKITPIPLGEELQETIVYSDSGMLLPKVALVDIDGVIMNARESTLFGSGDNPTALAVEKLQKAARDRRVKAVVLRINSPGGGVTASDIIYREVLKVRNGDPDKELPGKPVVAFIMDVGASGGYYVACGANEIMAEPTATTGSIGVIMLTFDAKGLLDKVGVHTDAIKSGPNKDAGSPFRPMQPQEREIFQTMVLEFYGRFVDVVAAARTKVPRDRLCKLADGRVYSGCQAQKLGLVDATGNLEDSLKRAKDLAGIKASQVVMYSRPEGYRGNIYSSTNPVGARKDSASLININVPDVLQRQGMFMYLWQP
jgi:protease IV